MTPSSRPPFTALPWRLSPSILGIACVLAAAAHSAPADAPAERTPIQLFNGKNLDGWYVAIQGKGRVAEQNIFRAADGAIQTYPDAAGGSPQPFAGLITEAEYGDYRLTLEYKWGVRKFAPRAFPDSVRDAGVCYDVHGADVIWPSSLECQIEEGDTGDVWAINTRATSTVHPENLNFVTLADGGVPTTRGFKPKGFQRFLRSYSYETPGWNQVEVTVRGDTATYRINGHVNNRVTGLKTWDAATASWKPLTRGKILLQAEGSEIFYRNVSLVPLEPLPTAPAPLKFQFGAGAPAPGTIAVAPTTLYSKEAGYGFEPAPPQSGPAAAAKPFSFSVAVPEGNYRVTLTLGDPGAETTTTVKAETRRLVLERIHTAAGKFETRTFTVNVRGPKISTGGEVNLDSREMNLATREPISRSWDDKLTLAFSDTHPGLASLEIEKADDAITVFILGDSTVTDQPGGPGNSWGQMAPRWFKPQVAVANHAESGETLKGFLKERRWDKVLDSINPGDYVLIEFGTNDSKNSGPQNIYPNQDFSETYAPADTTYKELLRRFVADAQQKGAVPVIVSPSARRGEVANPSSLGNYAAAAMAVAKELGVASIDLNTMGLEINAALGADAPQQFGDRTHHVTYGSYLQAKCIVEGIKEARLPLAKYIVDDFGNFDPRHPDPLPANFTLPADPGGGGRRRPPEGAPAPPKPANP